TFIADLYKNVLGRNPSPEEVAGWVRVLRANLDTGGVSAIAAAFVDSQENLNHPTTLAGFVSALYRAVLGREPGAAEVESWVQQGVIPAFNELISGLFGSAQFQQVLQTTPTEVVITRFYQRV